ncbi:MAG: ATP-dependent Clp protease adaptor ClpS [Spirochaetaceae bacterium]|jgi:ATP-dependent Clp protease adaptor protein ClpS|nr:ATP-dependent Clp protease adaptor ClpS [Spirochaetaceae bacterium]
MPVFGGDGISTVLKRKDKTKGQFKEPEDFRVVLLNDHFTTMDFVMEVLMTIFHKSKSEARKIMLDVHRKGRGVVGRYPFDIAQTKVNQVHTVAQQNEFPLRCVIEPV